MGGNSHVRRLQRREKERERDEVTRTALGETRDKDYSEKSPGAIFPNEWRLTADERKKAYGNRAGIDDTLCGYIRLPCWANGGKYKDHTQIYGQCVHTGKACHSAFPMGSLEDCTVYHGYFEGRKSAINYYNVDGNEPLKWEFFWREERVVTNVYLERKGKYILPYIEVLGSYRPRSKKVMKKKKKGDNPIKK
jgi:hypothetical protein